MQRWLYTMAAIAALGLSLAQARTADLRAVAVSQHAAPAGFGHSHLHLYRRFQTTLHVKDMAGGVPTDSTCVLPSSIRTGWKEGLLQAFDRPGIQYALQLCAARYNTVAHAHAAYRTWLEGSIAPRIKMRLAGKVGAGHIGNESIGLSTAPDKCPCGRLGNGTYELLFRRGTTVVDVTYLGPFSYAWSKFARLVRGTDRQLR